jgi:hypothetical protein
MNFWCARRLTCGRKMDLLSKTWILEKGTKRNIFLIRHATRAEMSSQLNTLDCTTDAKRRQQGEEELRSLSKEIVACNIRL